MRLHIRINANSTVVPFNHQHLLTGCIHKWLGWNDEHGRLSLYSFSRLENGIHNSNGLLFPKNTTFFFSSYNNELIKRLISGINSDPKMFFGLEVSDLVLQEDIDLTNRALFHIASPILIKAKHGDTIEHITFPDQRSSDFLTESLIKKMNLCNIHDNNLEVSFDTSYKNSKIMLIDYRGIKNKVSWCPVIIKGDNISKLFAWNVGLGNSTGIGFGAIK